MAITSRRLHPAFDNPVAEGNLSTATAGSSLRSNSSAGSKAAVVFCVTALGILVQPATNRDLGSHESVGLAGGLNASAEDG